MRRLNAPSRAPRRAARLPVRGDLPPGAGLQGPQPRHRLVLDHRLRVALPAGGRRALARGDQLRRRRAADRPPGRSAPRRGLTSGKLPSGCPRGAAGGRRLHTPGERLRAPDSPDPPAVASSQTGHRPRSPILSEVNAMDNDDLPVGRILSRRELFSLFGAAGGSPPPAAACSSPAGRRPPPPRGRRRRRRCRPGRAAGGHRGTVLRRRGPAAGRHRSDPATGTVKEGAPLQLSFQVLDVNGGACTPLPNAEVEVWHCDAAGV